MNVFRRLARLTPDPLRQRLRLVAYHARARRDVANRDDPILVYQMGKVGSMTIYESLRSLDLPNSTFHLHYLNPAALREAKQYLRQLKQRYPVMFVPHLVHGELLARDLERGRAKLPWHIVTLVRDPIGRNLSAFFDNARGIDPEGYERAKGGDAGPLIAIARERFEDLAWSSHPPRTDTEARLREFFAEPDHWFERELRQMFDIDVYDHPFDQEEGYAVIERPKARVLILRTDCIDRHARTLARFVGSDGPLELVKANRTEHKPGGSAYTALKNGLALPEATCREIYASRFCRHFFSPQSREALVRKWSEPASR